MTITATARNAEFSQLVPLLEGQQDSKIDAVVPATALRAKGGLIHVDGTAPILTESGVTQTTGTFRPTRVFDEGVADKLGIPIKYLRTLRDERPDLYDANVNGWLHGKSILRSNGPEVIAPADSRRFLFRGFAGSDGELGYGRALLSDTFAPVDHLDVLTAVLSGIRNAGVDVKIGKCDLTERRMFVQVHAPEISVAAPELLKGYRSPFTGNSGADNPLVFAGLVIENSETGNGATSIKPVITVQVCTNGMTITKDAMRSVHLGGKLPEGVIRWSADTQSKSLSVVTAKARDAVATFLSTDYVARTVAELERTSGIEVANADKVIELVSKKLAYTDAQRAGVLDHFIKGGQLTAGGVLQAVTSFCQTIDDADAAYAMQDTGIAAMEYAAGLR